MSKHTTEQLKNAMTASEPKMVSVGYAYPASQIANDLNKGKGCYFVQVATYRELSQYRMPVTGIFPTKEEAIKAANALGLPHYRYSLGSEFYTNAGKGAKDITNA